MSAQVDLRNLVIERGAARASSGRTMRQVMLRYVLPGSVIAVFGGLLLWSARDSLLPRTSVTVVPVITARAEAVQAGAPLFTAAGWVEPRPTAVNATALAEGVIERLLVIEGQEVKAGQPVAQLIGADARLALAHSQADVKLRESELASAQAALQAAEINLKYPLELQSAAAQAHARLAEKLAEQSNLAFQVTAADARARLAQQVLEARRSTAEALAGLTLQRAQSEWEAADAELGELKKRGPHLEAEIAALRKNCAAIDRQLALKTAQIRERAEAAAKVGAAEAVLKQAKIAVDTGQLRLERMTVRAPIDGRVLARVAQPGSRMMGQATRGEPDASTVVTLYDPHSLQVRADVRLEDVGQVLLGQTVRIETAAAKESFEGEVILVTSLADIQKNTLQVKVAIKSAPIVMRPDMLVQATFLAPAVATPSSGRQQLRVFIPRELIIQGEQGAEVRLADRMAMVARRQAVKLGRPSGGGLVEIVSGLKPGDRLIVEPRQDLADGERIAIRGEDTWTAAAGNKAP